MTRVGLVLGAGGIVGQAYHAGVLAALEHDLGWDARTADAVVGSSAGSVTAALLRAGVGASDLAAWAAEGPLSAEAEVVLGGFGDEPPEFSPPAPLDLLHGWHLPTRALISRTLRRPFGFRPQVAALTMVPRGRIDLESRLEVAASLGDGSWPEGLYLCAVRCTDGARVVFGRPGAPEVPVHRAVAASCAIPGYFAPVEIDGVDHFDGGVHSPTNADVLRHLDLDLVVVVSPMSAAHGRARTVDGAVRWSNHRRLEHEIRRLRSRGTRVVRFEPSPRSTAAMGLNAMAVDRSDRVVQAAFLDAGRRAADPDVAERLAPLASRPSRLELARTRSRIRSHVLLDPPPPAGIDVA